MRAFSREVKSSYYKYQSMPRNLTQEKRLQELHTLKQNEVKVGIYKYSTNDELGKGFSSKVYKGVEIQNIHKRYAIKVIELKKFRGSNLEMLQAEIQIHRNLVNDNVVRMYEVIKTPYFYYIILQYCPHGNLQEYIRQKKKLSENNAIQIMEQVLAGAKYLMGQGVIHRDLKPANILRVGNKWKISDFGFSVKSKYGFKDRMNVGTPLYMSPQSLKKSYYSAKTDIYSLGVILYEILDGKTPFQSRNEKELLQKMNDEIIIPSSIKNQKIREFIERSCQMNEAKRMSRQQLMQFYIRPVQATSNEKDSIIPSSFTQTVLHARRPSILSLHIRGQEQVLRQLLQIIYNEFILVKHLYSCIKNIDSFLLQKQVKQQFVLALFKLLLKMIRFLCDKKQNRLNLNHWQEITLCKSYGQLYQKMLDQSEIYEKQYLQQIKQIDIKIIRSINRRFPDLCTNNKISQRFYFDFNLFLVNIIRIQNHQLMLLYNSVETHKEDQKSKNDNESLRNGIEKQIIKNQMKEKTDQFMIDKSELISPAFMETKKDSRLMIKKLSKASSRAIDTVEKKDTIKNGQEINSQTKQSINNIVVDSIVLVDKYQALQSLFTIYRFCELRGNSEDNKDLVLQKIKVVENYSESKLQGKDYLDLRRLLRSL